MKGGLTTIMQENRRYHSVRLDKDLCKGCTNCLTHCPTAAIRVRGGRAHILDNAEEQGLVVITSRLTAFSACGLLYDAGLRGVPVPTAWDVEGK